MSGQADIGYSFNWNGEKKEKKKKAHRGDYSASLTIIWARLTWSDHSTYIITDIISPI